MDSIFSEQSLKENHRYQDTTLPVIKVDFSGNILYANFAAFPILKFWNCLTHKKIPSFAGSSDVSILQKFECSEMEIEADEFSYKVTVVPFNEGGFIGLYAYEKKLKDNLFIKSVIDTFNN